MTPTTGQATSEHAPPRTTGRAAWVSFNAVFAAAFIRGEPRTTPLPCPARPPRPAKPHRRRPVPSPVSPARPESR